jgi:hypothetical protein
MPLEIAPAGGDTMEPKRKLDRTEAEARIAKLALEKDKLELEISALAESRTPGGRFAELLRAGTVPVAFVGVLVTAIIGLGQFNSAQEARLDERFDKALTRLTSNSVQDRITGVSALALIASDKNTKRRSAALHALVDDAATESNQEVQDSIADVFRRLPHGQINVELNEPLSAALDHSRSLLAKSIVLSRRIQNARSLAVVRSLLGLRAEIAQEDAPSSQELSQLSIAGKIKYLETKSNPIHDVPEDSKIRLESLSRLIIMIVNDGGRSKDFSHIYCEKCAFPRDVSFDEVNFEGAFLSGADFSGASLKKVSFKNADIAGASFYGADLEGSDITTTGPFSPSVENMLMGRRFPVLACADLRGANLSGMVLLEKTVSYSSVYENGVQSEYSGVNDLHAKIDSTTKMDRFSIVYDTSYSDNIIQSKTKTEKERQFIDEMADGELSSSLMSKTWSRYYSYRTVANYASDPGNWSDVGIVQHESVSAKSVARVDPGAGREVARYLTAQTSSALSTPADFLRRFRSKDPPAALTEYSLATKCGGQARQIIPFLQWH